jgi:DNA repair protein RecO (recombination protein O)
MHAEHTLRVEAVVLRHSDWGEADRLLILYSRERGKLRCIAKGVRRLRSRKAGHLEPFTHAALLLARGRDFWIVTQAETLDAYLPLREDLVRTGYAAYVIELVDRFTYDEGETKGLFSLLVDTLRRITAAEDVFLAVRYFELRLLDFVGFRPELFRCVNCGEDIRPLDQFFSPLRGGVLCPNCGPKIGGAQPVSVETLKYIRHLQRSSYSEATRAHLTPAVQREMETLLQHYITYLLERGLNSPDFLNEVRGS